MLVYGEDAGEKLIDHIDGDPSNNRINNLRLVNGNQNLHNSKLRKDNTSGVKGINLHQGKWVARVGLNGYRHHLGNFNSLEEATQAVKACREKLHGDYARHH